MNFTHGQSFQHKLIYSRKNIHVFLLCLTEFCHSCLIHLSFSSLHCIQYWYNINITSYDIELILTLHWRHCQNFFDVNIVHIATSTMFNLYRVKIVDISLTLTSSLNVNKYCIVDDVDNLNKKEGTRWGYYVNSILANIEMLKCRRKQDTFQMFTRY